MIKKDEVISRPVSLAASGMRWRKASPNKHPAAKLTMYMNAFLGFLSANHEVYANQKNHANSYNAY